MKEKILTEIEGKDYLLKIQEDRIFDLNNKIKKHERFLTLCIITIFPLAIMGLLYIIEKIEQDPSLPKFFMAMIIITVILCGALALFGWLVEKIKNN
jgi:preprotein translocase subunit SecY